MMFKSKLSFFYAEQRARRDNAAPIPVRIKFGQRVPREIVRLSYVLAGPHYRSSAWTGRE